MSSHFSRRPLFAGMMAVLVAAVVLTPLVISLSRPSQAIAASCAEDANNLLRNGTMEAGAPKPLGIVARKWKPFVVGATVPNFENAGNEGYDPNGSQYIWRDFDLWDAGIFQKVKTLTPGQTYHFWMVWGQAIHDVAGNNERATLMNRQLGVDLNGGKDPTSPNVQWTVPYFGQSGFNRPEWHLHFTAAGPKATFFLRAQNGHTDGRNKVFFDTACLYPADGEPTSTPWTPTGQPTETPTATLTLTETATPTLTATPTMTATPILEVIEDTDPDIQYVGDWQEMADLEASGDTYHTARGVKGAAVSFEYAFTGSQVTVWYVADANRGKAKVFIDDVKVGVINQFAPETTYNLAATFDNLSEGTHELKVKNKGAKQLESSDSYIVLDALQVNSETAASPLRASSRAGVRPSQISGDVRGTPTLARRIRVRPFAPANPAAPTPDDPSVIWDPRLPGLNVYLEPASVAEGASYWKLIRADYQDGFESGGNHNMYYVVTDHQGTPVPNQTVWQSWSDDATSTLTKEDGTTDIAMWANYWPQDGPGPYSGYVGNLPSDVVRGMGLPGNNHVNFILYFQETIKSTNGEPTLTPTPTPTLTPVPATLVDDTDSNIGYRGAWQLESDAWAYNGTLHSGRGIKKGQPVILTYSFTGAEITIHYAAADNHGNAKVIIDGIKRGKIDQYAPNETYNLTHTFGNLPNGAHTLKIKNRGQKNRDASDSIIVLDALEPK